MKKDTKIVIAIISPILLLFIVMTIQGLNQKAENEKRSIERKIRQKKQEELSRSISEAKLEKEKLSKKANAENLKSKWRSLNINDKETKVLRILGEPDRIIREGDLTKYSYSYPPFESASISFDARNKRVTSIYEPNYRYIK